MTMDPRPQPDDLTRPTPDPAAPGEPSDAVTASEAAAATADAVPAGGNDAVPPTTGDAAATADTPATESVTTAQAVASVEAAAKDGVEATGPRRRARAAQVMRQLLIVGLGLGLLVGGVAIGLTAFQSTRAAPVTGDAVGFPVEQVPSVAREFIEALTANDADAVRSSLEKEPHLDLTREMDKFGITRIDKVEVLGTQVDGARSATEILMQYQSEEDIPFAINLVILVDGGKIEGFR